MNRHTAESLSERLRPRQLSDLIQPQDVIGPLERMVRERKLMNMLFHGQPGLGKTSAARILIASVEADAYEINGSRDTGIDTFRTDFTLWASCYSLKGGPKVCFIDEAEKLSPSAQAALRGVIEEYGHVTFLMTANHIEKLDPALLSRCLPIPFDISDSTDVCARYEQRLKQVGFAIDSAHLANIVRSYPSDLRAIANRIEFGFC